MNAKLKFGQLAKSLQQSGIFGTTFSSKVLNYPTSSMSPRCFACFGLQHLHTIPRSVTAHGIGTLARAPQKEADPVSLTKNDIVQLFDSIRTKLSERPLLRDISIYHFDGTGKCIRPTMALLMSGAVNQHVWGDNRLLESQKVVAEISEMIHVASLLHDDVIDGSATRRGKPTVHARFGHKRAVLGGDYIISIVTKMLAELENCEITDMLYNILVDLVQGEFMQLGSKENEDERFAHYLKKTFNKTASLLAYICKAEASLAGGTTEMQQVAFEYGKNCGIAFQLVDDVLDFTPNDQLGKPNYSDLNSGVATAPVLFACEQFPELHAMIMRRFQAAGDCDKAIDFVRRSNGIEQTRFLARKHCQEAVKQLSLLKPSPERQALILLTSDIIHRNK